MVGQAREGLGAHDVGRPALDELDHLACEQPALAHGVAEVQDLARALGGLPDGAKGLKALAVAQGLANGLAQVLQVVDQVAEDHVVFLVGNQRLVAEDAVGQAEEEEVDQAGHVGLAALLLDHLDHLVVGGGMELDQDLTHNAHTRLAAKVDAGQLVELADDLRVELLGLAQLHGGHGLVQVGHPLLEQGVGAAGHGLVGAHAVEQHHQQIAHEQGGDGRLEHGGREVPAGVRLVGGTQRQGNHGYMAIACLLEALANERDVVGGAAAAARLADHHSGAAHVVAAAGDCLEDLAGDQDGGVADVVVDVLEAGLDGTGVDGRQELHVVAKALEDWNQQLEVYGRHLGGQDGPALVLHLLGELNAGELGGLGLALHIEAARGAAAADLEVVVDRLVEGLFIDCRGGVALLAQGGEQRAQADARCTEVGDLVDLEAGVDLAAALQDLLDLVGSEGIQAAAEAVELDQVEVVALGDHLGSAVEAGVVHPLVIDAQVALHLPQVGNGVLGEHGQAVAGDQLGNGVVDLSVVVVGAAGQHDAVPAGFLDPAQHFLALGAHGGLEALVDTPSDLDGVVDLLARGEELAGHAHASGGKLLAALDVELLEEAQLEGLLVVVGQEGVEEVDLRAAQLVDVELERLAVAHDDGAVVVVVGRLVFLALPAGAGHPDEVDVALQQVHDVAVAQLGGVADAFGGHRLDAGLIGLLRAGIAQLDVIAQRGEEAVPEGVVLVHVERAGDAHRAILGLCARQALAVEEQVLLELVEVGHLGQGVRVAGALLAAVARDEAVVLAGLRVLAKVVDGEQAVVVALLAAHRGVLDLELVDLLRGEQGGAVAGGAVARQQGGAVGAHVARNVRAHGLVTRQVLEGP